MVHDTKQVCKKNRHLWLKDKFKDAGLSGCDCFVASLLAMTKRGAMVFVIARHAESMSWQSHTLLPTLFVFAF